MTVFEFQPASRKQMKARIAVSGVSGSGKTYTALSLAEGFSPDGNVAVIDSQFGQSRLYSDRFDFRVLELDTHSPLTYAAAIRAATDQGFDVVIVDSVSLAWSGKDGALAQVDKAAEKSKGNSYIAWGKVTPMQQELVDSIQGCKSHIIVTLRSKQEYVLEEGGNGKMRPVKKGMGIVQRDGFEFALDIEISMDSDHTGEITKTRYADLDGMVIEKPDSKLAEYILERLNTGEDAGEEHWSQSFKKRSFLLAELDKLQIPHETLFACFAVNDWKEMKIVPLPEKGSSAIVQRVHEYHADNK